MVSGLGMAWEYLLSSTEYLYVMPVLSYRSPPPVRSILAMASGLVVPAISWVRTPFLHLQVLTEFKCESHRIRSRPSARSISHYRLSRHSLSILPPPTDKPMLPSRIRLLMPTRPNTCMITRMQTQIVLVMRTP